MISEFVGDIVTTSEEKQVGYGATSKRALYVHFDILILILIHIEFIHSKSWSSWSTNSADNFEFSAERLSENAKTNKQMTRAAIILRSLV